MKDSENEDTDSTLDAFEKALEQVNSEHYILRLFVTGTTPKSAQAIQNIQRICEEHLQGRYKLEVIDIYQQPEKAKEAQIVAVPTLIKQLPLPLRKVVGNLSDVERVVAGLGLQMENPGNKPQK
ncbi:MAG: thiol-disulfide isomerase [Chloroflexi bacterium]|uniref:Circadian clock KaiB family protein n=1 Tax=Candidatus Chlorohelix allophototropha TaxID=3003348 RepID=A0A8T7M8K3_9CHLR|nr:thiol-disulfide isomerase [Chloroflexota bacterium]WJW68317.1 circadian clock KaiB family protein [Chloroflexota bacterium L227-S17]